MIRLHEVSKEYSGGVVALRGVDLQVDEGEFVAITGPTGAGKTTLFSILYGRETPDSGGVLVDGRNLSRLDRSGIADLRRRIGLVMDHIPLIGRHTVLDNVAVAAELAGDKPGVAREKAAVTLEMVGLGHAAGFMPSVLSAGEQQFVRLARALVHNPQLVLADEPTRDLDPDRTLEMLRILTETCQGGTTVILSCHNMEALAVLRCRVMIMSRGRIYEGGYGEAAHP